MRENAERAAGTAARSAKNTDPLYYFAKVDPKNDEKSEDKKNIFSYSLLLSKHILNGSWERTNFQRVPLRTADVPERGAHGGDSLSNYSRTGPIPNCILAVTWEKLPAARARRSDARARRAEWASSGFVVRAPVAAEKSRRRLLTTAAQLRGSRSKNIFSLCTRCIASSASVVLF